MEATERVHVLAGLLSEQVYVEEVLQSSSAILDMDRDIVPTGKLKSIYQSYSVPLLPSIRPHCQIRLCSCCYELHFSLFSIPHANVFLTRFSDA